MHGRKTSRPQSTLPYLNARLLTRGSNLTPKYPCCTHYFPNPVPSALRRYYTNAHNFPQQPQMSYFPIGYFTMFPTPGPYCACSPLVSSVPHGIWAFSLSNCPARLSCWMPISLTTLASLRFRRFLGPCNRSRLPPNRSIPRNNLVSPERDFW